MNNDTITIEEQAQALGFQLTWVVVAATMTFIWNVIQVWEQVKDRFGLESKPQPWTKDDHERLRRVETLVGGLATGLTHDEHKQLYEVHHQLCDVHDWLEKDDASGRKLYYNHPSLREDVKEIKAMLNHSRHPSLPGNLASAPTGSY